MVKGSFKKDSLRELAEKFNTNYETIRRLKKEKIDFSNRDLVISKLLEDDRYTPPADYLKVSTAPQVAPNTEQGLRAAIERLRVAEVTAHTAYLESLSSNPAISMRCLKEWNVILDQLRKIEESNPDIEEANSNSISKEELSKELGILFKNLRQDLDALPNKIATLGQNTKRDELFKIVEAETNKIIDSLFQNKVGGGCG
ncbi:MAG: hypothetical protein WCO97_05505 [bacterium]